MIRGGRVCSADRQLREPILTQLPAAVTVPRQRRVQLLTIRASPVVLHTHRHTHTHTFRTSWWRSADDDEEEEGGYSHPL